VKVPESGNVTVAGFDEVLVAGLPPGKTQEYEAIEPLGLVPVPEKLTDWPGTMV